MPSLHMCEKHENWKKFFLVQGGDMKNLWDIYLGIIRWEEKSSFATTIVDMQWLENENIYILQRIIMILVSIVHNLMRLQSMS